MSYPEVFQIIDELNINNKWKQKFKEIHTIYYENYINGKIRNPLKWKPSERYKRLKYINKCKFRCWGNLWAFLFGPFYYLFKGMWKKGLIYLIILWLCPFRIINTIILLYIARTANLDYFKHKVLQNPKIKINPSILDNSVDNDLFISVMQRPIPKSIPLIGILLVLILFMYIFIFATLFKVDQDLKHFDKKYSPAGYQTTVQECTQKINHGKADYKIYYELGYAQMRLGKNAEALKSFDKSIELNPQDYESYYYRGMTKNSLKNYQDAIKDFDKAIEINPNKYSYAYYLRGNTYYFMGNYKNALEDYNKAIEQHNADPDYYEARAYTKVYLSDKSSAIKDLEKEKQLYIERDKLFKNNKNQTKIQEIDKYINSIR